MAESSLADRVATEPREAQLVQLVARMARGDESALSELYDATLSRVYGLALRICRNPGTAEDVTSEVYYQCWTDAARYDPRRGRVIAWLLVICRSRAIDAVRARETAFLDDDPDALADPEQQARDADPEDLLDIARAGTAVHAALAKLAPVQRQMIRLAFFRALSHQEIAAHVGMPLGTVKGHIRRSLELLRRDLEG